MLKTDVFGRWVSAIGRCLVIVCWSLVISVVAFAEDVKKPNVAGAFYPKSADDLASAVRWYLDNAGDVKADGDPAVLIVPHAGYVYSGPVAAYGFKAVAGRGYATVVILGPSHYFPFHGASVYAQGVFQTPLGSLDIDAAAASSLLSSGKGLVVDDKGVFEQEHAIEVELPFLQSVLKPGFKILPVLVGDMSYNECLRLATLLTGLAAGRNMLVVVSTDLSHYRTYREALEDDARTAAYLEAFDTKGLWDAVASTGWNVCGIRPLVAGMEYARQIGADDFSLLKAANSGDTAGGRDRVVGYLSAVLSRPQKNRPAVPPEDTKSVTTQQDTGDSMLTLQDKKRLLEIARQTIAAHTAGKPLPVFQESSAGLNLKCGCFVTLREHGNLRGCIGLFTSDEPLYRSVQAMAVASSSQDYRFSPVRPQELKDITIEISVLSEPAQIDDWKKIRLGTDGVIVRRGYSSGVFLPQVATETGWSLETFLGELCSQKAGLPSDCYKDPGTKIYTFQAEIFSEEESAR